MLQLETDPTASIRDYGFLRSAAQIATYIGVLATTCLSVFDLLYRQRTDPWGLGNRYSLNAAGRARLLAFILISVLTLSSAVVKDYADRKLGTMYEKVAQTEREVNKASQLRLMQLLESTKQDTERVLTQNENLQVRFDHIATSGAERPSQQSSVTSGGVCLRSAAQTQLEQINTFLKERLDKSPARSFDMARDPLYSAKEVAYQQQTSKLYIERFWQPVHALILQAIAAGALKGAEGFSDPAFYPEPRWSEAMLKPGLKEIVSISESAPAC